MDITKPTRVNGDVLDFENAVENLLKREAREEAGIETQDSIAYINSVAFVRPDGIPVVLVKFAAKYKSGEVVLEKGAFTDHAWVDAEEVKKYPCIDGVDEEVRKTIELFRTNKI
jgi:NADH pyrophosphatase NudC (nudix superfamily)